MQRLKNMNRKTTVIVMIIMALCVGVIAYYKLAKVHLVNNDDLKTYTTNLIDASSKFKSNKDLEDYILKRVKAAKLIHVTDRSGNIIVSKEASSGKESLPDTVVCVDYNYKTADTSANSIATALYVAKTASTGGHLTVIFMNNDRNLHAGAKSVSKSYFTDDANVIYLDSGEKTYISRNSFSTATSTVAIPYSTETRTCDTGIKIKISGIKTGDPSSTISAQPNPITALSTILTNLKNKSTSFELADVNVSDEGNMYPSSIEATVLINSYSQEDFTEYLDGRIEKYLDEYRNDFPELEYKYTIISDEKKLPSTTYSAETSNDLINFLYTVKNGTYRYDQDVPAGAREGDIFGINCLENMYIKGKKLCVTVNTSAVSDTYTQQILEENTTAANFSGAAISTSDQINAFSNSNDDLSALLSDIYTKVNNVTSKDINIKDDDDLYFTPCSYFNEKNYNMNIVHICEADDSSAKITNTILNFLTTNGTGYYSNSIVS